MYKQQKVIAHSSEAAMFKIETPADLVSGETLFFTSWTVPFDYIFT
jgi:hypothetical protein